MSDYISRDELLDRLNNILDCSDMVFEPDDHCCKHDDCASCKWSQTLGFIKRLVYHFPAADVRPKWISVKEKLPKHGETVLVYGSQGGIYTAKYDRARHGYEKDHWWKLNSKNHFCNPSNWMLLPEPPEMEARE